MKGHVEVTTTLRVLSLALALCGVYGLVTRRPKVGIAFVRYPMSPAVARVAGLCAFVASCALLVWSFFIRQAS